MKALPHFRKRSLDRVRDYIARALTNERQAAASRLVQLVTYEDGHFRAIFRPDYFELAEGENAPTKSQWNTLKKRMKRLEDDVFIFKAHGVTACGPTGGTCYYVDFGFVAHESPKKADRNRSAKGGSPARNSTTTRTGTPAERRTRRTTTDDQPRGEGSFGRRASDAPRQGRVESGAERQTRRTTTDDQPRGERRYARRDGNSPQPRRAEGDAERRTRRTTTDDQPRGEGSFGQRENTGSERGYPRRDGDAPRPRHTDGNPKRRTRRTTTDDAPRSERDVTPPDEPHQTPRTAGDVLRLRRAERDADRRTRRTRADDQPRGERRSGYQGNKDNVNRPPRKRRDEDDDQR